jgi:hypothetical protein
MGQAFHELGQNYNHTAVTGQEACQKAKPNAKFQEVSVRVDQ